MYQFENKSVISATATGNIGRSSALS